MIDVLLALAGLALTPASSAIEGLAPRKQAVQQAPSAAPQAKAQDAAAAVLPAEIVRPGKSEAVTRVASWIAASGDNYALPYIIIDKQRAAAFLFDGEGNAVGDAPVLIGVAEGDDATPGIGAKSLAEIGPAEKTTPAGRFLARFGRAAGNKKVLWVDYATSVALHPIPPGTKKERRRERMLSPAIDDNRITFGCINVPLAFYNKGLRPLFEKQGGYVYVLPDSKPLEVVFPRLRAQRFTV